MFLGKSAEVNTLAVEILQWGLLIKYQHSSGWAGNNCSPTPWAKAAKPCTNMGTSAPKLKPRSDNWLAEKLHCQRALRATNMVAALEEPPPKPPPIGSILSILIFAPKRGTLESLFF